MQNTERSDEGGLLKQQITLSDLRSGPISRPFVIVTLLVMAWLTLQLRLYVDIGPWVLDGDTTNYGLGALDYDLLAWQPHPPGYPGWIVFLKFLHLFIPGVGPNELAKWGARLASVATLPVAFWVTRLLLTVPGQKDPPVFRPLMAAFLTMVTPILWYYGADGQSHAGEALGMLVLFGLTVVVRRRPTLSRVLLLVAIFGVAGSIRPTLAALNAPLLVWALWGHPLRSWVLAALVGVLAVAAWYVPMVWLSGGWEAYQRATQALVSDNFVVVYSPFGERSHEGWLLINMLMLIYSLAFALIPALGWGRHRVKVPGAERWGELLWVVILTNVAFYSALFISESGYVIAPAALVCLVPATWPRLPSLKQKLRAAVALTLPGLVFLGGPVSLVAPPMETARLWLPTLSRIAGMDVAISLYYENICAASASGGMLVVTDNPILGHTRMVPMICPDALALIHLYAQPFNPDLDNWLIYDAKTLRTHPTDVPLELGPPAEMTLHRGVGRVVMARDASDEMFLGLRSTEVCPPLSGADPVHGAIYPDAHVVWSQACMPQILRGENVINIPPPRGR